MNRRNFLFTVPAVAVALKTKEVPVNHFLQASNPEYVWQLQEVRPGGKVGMFNPEGGDLGRGSSPTYEKVRVRR